MKGPEEELVKPLGQPPIAVVNGRSITRKRVIDLLLRTHGAVLLEQLIGLEAAAAAAAERGLTVTQADVDREYDLALGRLADPLASVTSGPFDRQAAEELLATVLRRRNSSQEEFDIVMRRNANLRKLVESQQTVTEGQLRREFQRVYGRRVQVRHIQLATLREVEHVKERLGAGEDFAELATRYSANVAGARDGGLLEPFSAEDDDVPLPLRRAAFALGPGTVSGAVHVGEWYHLIKLERVFEAQARDFERVHGELERAVRTRVSDSAMFDLFEKLFREARIRIDDPVLEAAFERRHPGRAN